MNFKRWLYSGGRPNWLAAILNRFWVALHARGIAPDYLVALDVRGRRSGQLYSVPLVLTIYEGDRFLVSMLGAQAAWVQNMKASNGNVVLRHGRREAVTLQEIPVAQRAPILKAYLKRAPGARPHLPVDQNAPLAAFAAIAERYPVFRVEPANAD